MKTFLTVFTALLLWQSSAFAGCPGRCEDSTGRNSALCTFQSQEWGCSKVPGCFWVPPSQINFPGRCEDGSGRNSALCTFQSQEFGCSVVPGCFWVPGQSTCQR
jgi:hypothetical protein